MKMSKKARLRYWLLKTEPSTYSIQDLADAEDQTASWDGVRNYQARNFMRDDMRIGDRVLIYHSNAKPPAVAGTARVVRESYPDHTAWDPNEAHYDPKSSQDHPRWFMVDVQLDEIFTTPISLNELRETKSLAEMELLRKGSRLSVQPVRKQEFETILKIAKQNA
jgi:predicted RNA-binding protein with PUA-like domain